MSTTRRGRFEVEPYTRTAAQIITALLPRHGDTVPRAAIREAWYRRYPDQKRVAVEGHGPVGRARLNGALRDLDDRGVIERRPHLVRVVDRATLAKLSQHGTATNGEGQR